MTIKIPQHYLDRGKTAYEKIVNEIPDKNKTQENEKEPISFQGSFNKSDYIQIPNQDFVMAIAETNKNLKYEEAHKTTLKQGLIIPTPHQFMLFHNYIIGCYKNNKPIFDAAANLINEQTKNDLYRQLTQDCWTWLNGKFNMTASKKTIEYITGLDVSGNFLTKTEGLEDFLPEDCYVDFTKLTKDGLANLNSKYSNQNFMKGENIYFYYPRDSYVAGFCAVSGRAGLDCSRDPSGTIADLGVRAAVEGQ